MHIESLSGEPWRLYLESADQPGVLAVEPDGPVPSSVIHAAAVDTRMIVEQWLDDCILMWDWLNATVEDGQVVLKVYKDEREFTHRVKLPVHPISGDLVVQGVQLLPRRPSLTVESNVGVQVVTLSDVVFTNTAAPVAPVLIGRGSR